MIQLGIYFLIGFAAFLMYCSFYRPKYNRLNSIISAVMFFVAAIAAFEVEVVAGVDGGSAVVYSNVSYPLIGLSFVMGVLMSLHAFAVQMGALVSFGGVRDDAKQKTE